MSTLTDSAQSAEHLNGIIVLTMRSGSKVRFPVTLNPRLARGTPQELANIELSPFGLHWPDLDEDLSIRGILAGDYGQPATVRL
ncbi:MAG: hypothetical protein RIS56_2728 [Verrucomicrobiota bacterium]|jgi:hypothetical protein